MVLTKYLEQSSGGGEESDEDMSVKSHRWYFRKGNGQVYRLKCKNEYHNQEIVSSCT